MGNAISRHISARFGNQSIVFVCVFIKMHITAQSGPVILNFTINGYVCQAITHGRWAVNRTLLPIFESF